MLRILIVKTGTTDAPIIPVHGDYDAWFRACLSGAGVSGDVQGVDGGIDWRRCDAEAGEPLPDLSGTVDPAGLGGVDGVLICGSPRSVTERAPWMVRLGQWMLNLGDTPLLAVCFGHQLLAMAMGCDVAASPSGREIGTVEMTLSAAGRRDPLFKGLPGVITVQATHRDSVLSPPPGAVHLAGNQHTHWQAFGVGESARAVQFHPEVRAATLADLLRGRGQSADVRPAPHGATILRNWLRMLQMAQMDQG